MSLLFHIAERALNRPLLLHPDKVPLILGMLDGRLPTDAVSLAADPAFATELPDAARQVLTGPLASRFVGSSVDTDGASGRRTGLPYRRTESGVAVVSVLGSLVNRGAWIGASSG